MPTPKQTRRLLRQLLESNLLTLAQFQAIHHLNDHALSFYEYLGGIGSYEGMDSRNLAIHYKLESLAKQYGLTV